MDEPIVHDIAAALGGLPDMEFKPLGDFDLGGFGVFRCGAGV